MPIYKRELLLRTWLTGIRALLAPRPIFIPGTRLSSAFARDMRHTAASATIGHSFTSFTVHS